MAARKNNQPFSVALNISYSTYHKNKVVTASFSLLRDAALTDRITVYPELGVSKSVGTESDDIKPLFFVGVGLVGKIGQQFQIMVTPHLGVQDGAVASGIVLSLALLP